MKLSNTGKKVARRSFAGCMAVLFCVTGLSTNLWGFGSDDIGKITGSFEVAALEPSADVAYSADQTYYDAGTIVMNAHYDSTTGTKLTASSANYKAYDWDVVSANSYVASATQNGDKGVTIEKTTDIADAGRFGSALTGTIPSGVLDSNYNDSGISCLSDYANMINGTNIHVNGGGIVGATTSVNYDKYLPDYEAPAAVDTETYVYMAKGTTAEKPDGNIWIRWTLLAWPQDQNTAGLSVADMRARLDTISEISNEWSLVHMTNMPVTDSSRTWAIPGEMIAGGSIVSAGNASALDKTSLFYQGQPQWLSGNTGSFDSWNTETSEHYLKNMGLWSRIETDPVRYTVSGTTATIDNNPGETLDLYAPGTNSDAKGAGDTTFSLNESNDTSEFPLYAFMSSTYSNVNSLDTMAFKDILDDQLSKGVTETSLDVPTYNIRGQLYHLWTAFNNTYLHGSKSSLKLISGKDYNAAVAGGTEAAYLTNGTTFSDVNITGTRLYSLASYLRTDTTYAKTHAIAVGRTSAEESALATISASEQWNSVYGNSIGYGINATSSPVYFVFDKADAGKNIVHVDNIPNNVMNVTDLYTAYGADLAQTLGTVAASDVANTIVPYLVRTDAYYDATEDYQRAAGVIYGYRDPSQPTIDTSAIDDLTAGKLAVANVHDKITDTVTYSNLTPGTSYTLKGVLSTTGSYSEVSTAQATFTPTTASGTVDVTFPDVDTSGYVADKLVVLETLYLSSAMTTPIVTHDSLTDSDQTITYVGVGQAVINTAATLSSDQKSVADVITYTGLTASMPYVITTKAYDSTTGAMVVAKGTSTDLAVTTDFTPSSANGQVTVTFTGYDPTIYSGHSIVIYESIATQADPATIVVNHANSNDLLQTVILESNVKVSTVAVSGTGSKYLDAIDSEKINDTVTVTGLTASASYTARAKLYDVTSGAFVTNSSNKVMTWTKAFAADTSGNGSVVVPISAFSASDRAGHTLVVYEDILDSIGNTAATHANNSDANQTLTVNKAGISTVLTDSSGNKNATSSATMTFNDTISYSNLVPGNKYYMVSTLVDKTTGKTMTDSNGSAAVVTSIVFNANSTGTNKGSSTFTFSNMATALSGKTLVAYNDLYRVTDSTAAGTTVTSAVAAELVSSEHDLTNANQTVTIDGGATVTTAAIDTVAKGTDGTKYIPLATNSTIKDTVSYSGLTPGKTYTLTADVYDTSTTARASGYTSVKTMDFTADDDGKGDTVMTIDLNTMNLSGHKLVVYEVLTYSGNTVCQHRDFTDADQTVTVGNSYQASIDTVATDSRTGGKTMIADSSAVIRDTVKYDGLDTKQSYVLTSTVYDKATGTKVNGIGTVTNAFTPSGTSGSFDVNIPVNGANFTAGQSLVVYEDLTTTSRFGSSSAVSSATSVATHKDISDADQTVTFVKMSTYLTGDGTTAKVIHAGSDAYAIDTCSFTGLTPKKTYVITTQLLDSAVSSNAVTLGGSIASSTASGTAVASRVMEFTPTTSNGSIAMQINANTDALSGHSLVAIATVTDKATGAVIATHNDKTNKDQTILVQTRVEAQTGSAQNSWFTMLLVMIMLSACASYLAGYYNDKHHEI